MDSLLARPAALGVRVVSCQSFVHERRDPGVYSEAQTFLRERLSDYRFALAVCDRDGSGQEARPREEIERKIEENLAANGWEERAAAVVIDPELESWVWGDWRASRRALNWPPSHNLREWLITQGLLESGGPKPLDPKAALKSALRFVDQGWSSSLHQQIASEARIHGCTDPAFLKLRSVLQSWFPIAT